MKVLASDEFEGRAPGSAGEEKTVAYLSAQFQSAWASSPATATARPRPCR